MYGKKDFQRIFEFIVKNHGGTCPWDNKTTKKLIRWALFYKKMFIVRDVERIAGIGIAWRTPHPEINLEAMGLENTEAGDFLYVFRMIIHPEYKNRGVDFLLFNMALMRFRGIKKFVWESHSRTGNELVIVEPEKLLERLANGKILKGTASTRN